MAKQKGVKIDEIAFMLNVDEWFDADRFSKLTGIARTSCCARIGKILKAKPQLLKSRGRQYLNIEYCMTAEMQKMMIELGAANTKAHGKIAANNLSKSDKEKVRLVKSNPYDKLVFSTAWV